MNIPIDSQKNKVEKGRLYLVATPIGNMADITLRALKTLEECDFVAAEDTRNTGKLLAYYDIHRPLFAYHEHNKRTAGEKIAERLLAGESCALVTDAGMPGISDPGFDLVCLCREKGIGYTVVPGPCAAVTALVLSGMAEKEFAFIGFLSGSDREKKEKLEALSAEKRPLILYEAPHRLTDTLTLMRESFAKRKIAFCRELTKINEEVAQMTLEEALSFYQEREPRGEYVLIVEGAPDEACFWAEMDVPSHVAFYQQQGMSKMDAMKAAARDRGCSKNEIYKQMIDG